MQNLRFYEVRDDYIDYCRKFDKLVEFHKADTRKKKKKYLGIILEFNNTKFYIPLSKFKEKHKKMKETLDLIKIGTYAVLNINNMIPIPDSAIIEFNIKNEKDLKYKKLLTMEYRICLRKSKLIIDNAKKIFQFALEKRKNRIIKRSCDFLLLIEKAKEYKGESKQYEKC